MSEPSPDPETAGPTPLPPDAEPPTTPHYQDVLNNLAVMNQGLVTGAHFQDVLKPPSEQQKQGASATAQLSIALREKAGPVGRG